MNRKSLGNIRKDDSGALTFCATSLAVDRSGEVVIPKGCESTLDTYKANPILLYGHMSSPLWDGQKESLPIGRVANLRFSADEKELLYDAEFSKANEFGQIVRGMVEEGALNATSIGFRPRTMSTNAVLEGQKGITHTEWDMLENSICPVPCNQEAVRRSIDKSAVLSRFKDFLLVPEVKLDDGVYRGVTDIGGDGHQHSFLVEVRDGAIVLGATSFEGEHFHQVMNSNLTDLIEGHTHTLTLEPVVNGPSDIVQSQLGIPKEILNWSREDLDIAKHFISLTQELPKKEQAKQDDAKLEELAKAMRAISNSLSLNIGDTVKELIPAAFDKALQDSVRGNV